MTTTNRKKLVFGGVGLLVVLVLFVQGALFQELFRRADQAQLLEMKGVLIDSIRNLDTPTVVETTTGRQFIPAYHVILPTFATGRVVYRSSQEPTELWLNESGVQAQAITRIRTATTLDEVFQGVDRAQKCSRQTVMMFTRTKPANLPASDKVSLYASVPLKDGRTVDIYRNDSCGMASADFLELLKKVSSF